MLANFYSSVCCGSLRKNGAKPPLSVLFAPQAQALFDIKSNISSIAAGRHHSGLQRKTTMSVAIG